MLHILDIITPPPSGGGVGLFAAIAAAFTSFFASIKMLFKKGKKNK